MARRADEGPGVSGATSAYDTLALSYDRRWSRYLSLSIDLARANLFANPGDRLLDVGCGTGQLLERIARQEPGVHACGVDPSGPMLAVAQRRVSSHARLIRGEACALPLDSASVDWLVSTSALHHIDDVSGALDEFYRVLRPGGRIVLVDWAYDFVAMRLLTAWLRQRERTAFSVYTATELHRLLVKSAFENVRVRAQRMTWMWGMLVATAQRGA